MKIRFSLVRNEGSETLNEYVKSELGQGLMLAYINSEIKRRIPAGYSEDGELMLTFSARNKRYVTSAYLKYFGGPILQVEQSSRDLYSSIDRVFRKLSTQIKFYDRGELPRQIQPGFQANPPPSHNPFLM